ncbi:putative Transposable element Tc1 transposase-like 22, partial [Homarus americanus]
MNTTQQRIPTGGQIIVLREGLMVRAIAARLAVSTSTVKRWIRRYVETVMAQEIPPKILCLFSERNRRPRLTIRDENAAIIATIQNNSFSNAVAIREALHLNVCAQTAGIQHRVPAVKERLTGRLQFVQQHMGEELEFWSRVVFRDEKNFASTNYGKIQL